jgi:hypothetical protein
VSGHDETRLETARTMLSNGRQLKDLTLDELVKLENETGLALAGIQSTDDPAEAYGAAEEALLTRLLDIKAERSRRNQ